VNMLYICENNGTYGLTKGQFSATNDPASKNRKGLDTPFDSIDICNVAIELGAGFVARAFSGDKAQLIPLIKAGLHYRGFALIDVISPCVTFNNHTTSTKSYDYVRDHNHMVGRLDLVPVREEITADYAPGTTATVTQHDGAQMKLSKLATEYDPTDLKKILPVLERHKNRGEIATGLLYLDAREQDLHDLIGTTNRPLNEIPESELCPGADALNAINLEHR